MPAPSTAAYSSAVTVAAGNALKDLIDSGSAGLARIRDASDNILATYTLTDPCGTVHSTTGVLTLGFAATTVNASAGGTAAYGEVCSSDGTVRWSAPAEAGSAPVTGKFVINTLALVNGAPVTIVGITLNG